MEAKTISSDVTRDFFLMVLSLFVFFFHLGRGSLASWDEAIYAAVARETLQTHHWWMPTYVGNLWLEKPPLCIWLIGFFYKIFGISEFSVRFFSALCGLGTIGVTYVLGAKLFNRWTGFFSAMVLLTSGHFPHYARFGDMDAPLVFFMSASLLFFWLGRGKKIYFSLSGLMLGLAFLTKGVAAVFVLPIMWIYCIGAGELWILKSPAYWTGMLICAAVAIPWNVWEILKFPHSYAIDIHQQILLRLTEGFEGHRGNLGFYFEVISSKYHPWILPALLALPLFILKAFRTRKKEMVFVTVWMLVVFAGVSAVSTKLHWYILPFYPALSICVAWLFACVISEKYTPVVSVFFVGILALHVHKRFFEADYSHDIKSISPSVQKIVPEKEKIFLYHSN